MYSCSAMQFGKERNDIFSLPKTSDTFEARIRGVQNMMTSFNFYFGCTLGEQVLMQTDNLSRALQNSSTSAAQSNRLAQDLVSFSLFLGSDLTAQIYRVSQSQSGTKLENRTPTTFLKLPKTITDESTLTR